MAEYSEARTAPAAHQRHCVLSSRLSPMLEEPSGRVYCQPEYTQYTQLVCLSAKATGCISGSQLVVRPTDQPTKHHTAAAAIAFTRLESQLGQRQAGWVLVKGVAALATQENENAIFQLLTRYSPSNTQSVERSVERID